MEDQLPISQDSRIEVELEDAIGADFNRETGKLTWKLTDGMHKVHCQHDTNPDSVPKKDL
jgi:hypothetical protein